LVCRHDGQTGQHRRVFDILCKYADQSTIQGLLAPEDRLLIHSAQPLILRIISTVNRNAVLHVDRVDIGAHSHGHDTLTLGDRRLDRRVHVSEGGDLGPVGPLGHCSVVHKEHLSPNTIYAIAIGIDEGRVWIIFLGARIDRLVLVVTIPRSVYKVCRPGTLGTDIGVAIAVLVLVGPARV
jgi:hypothetical protein